MNIGPQARLQKMMLRGETMLTSTPVRHLAIAMAVLLGCAASQTHASALILDVSVDPGAPEVKVGSTLEIKVTADQAIGINDVVWSGDADFVEIGDKSPGDTPTSVKTVLKVVKFSPVPVALTVKVKGSSKTIQLTTVFSAENFPAAPDTGFTIDQNSSQFVRLQKLDAGTSLNDVLEISTDNDSVVHFEFKNTAIVVSGGSPGTTQLTIKRKRDHQAIKAYIFTVAEAAASIDVNTQVIHLTVGQEFDLDSLKTKVTGKAKGDLTSRFPPSYDTDNSDVARITDHKLIAQRTPQAGELSPSLKIAAAGLPPRIIPLDITASVLELIVTPSSRAVGVGRTDRVDAQIRDSDNQLVTAQDIEWTISDADK